MSQHEKLLAKLLSLSKTFSFDEAEALLNYYSYYRDNKGKTSGSRVAFIHRFNKSKIMLHKPHPRKELLEYQMKQLIAQLQKEGII